LKYSGGDTKTRKENFRALEFHPPTSFPMWVC